MRILDVLLGRTRAVPPNLDRLFALPAAAVTLQASSPWRPTGVGSVCVKPAEGGAFAGLQEEIDRLLALDGGRYERRTDAFGYVWLVRQTSPDDLAGLVTDLHAVNAALTDAGFGAALLCTVVAFSDGARPLGLIYLYKRGSWYPFVPVAEARRDNPAELAVREILAGDLPIEPDLSRWFPVWGAPGLDAPGGPKPTA
jgi:hypothetical protein